ncbi:MAG: hypothetical protein EPO52_09795 [Herbiconiux sp.]|uniref:hypothetical protein n=1 Tax=Herbiconiux sp. TaxID=1871186 RepID=UPI00122B83FA|nr:hypothetical protein [Herbiconiux sp.]TAJ48418.1 MAG: hypothetical protein EPO52_09795 [Herbiconiux sp.]
MARGAGVRACAATFAVLLSASCVLTGTTPVFADACESGRGLQPRVLETDTPGRVEKQYCMGGEWTTYMVLQYDTSAARSSYFETVEDPLSLNLNIDARSFFELKNYDPYAIVDEFKARIAKGIELTGDDRVKERLALATTKVQAQLDREALTAKESCRARSVLSSHAGLMTGVDWLPPVGNGPPGTSQITYEISADMLAAAQAAILNAIDQYHYAVISQDSALTYPSDIVPRQPSDSAPATIRFTFTPSDGESNWIARADIDQEQHVLGVANRWVSGEIEVSALGLEYFTPASVGHEIGHVMGIDHSARSIGGTMDARSAQLRDPPWTPTTRASDPRSVAFDSCMFLPADRPMW